MTEQTPEYKTGNEPATQEAPAGPDIGAILDLVVPAFQELKEDLAGLSELRSRVELAKVFVWRGADGNMNFNQSDYEAVWSAISGQNQDEKPAN
jgi:hypothetical protein